MKRCSAGLVVLLLSPIGAGALAGQTPGGAESGMSSRTVPFSVVEASIVELRAALEQKRVTSREIVLQYLVRIALYENRLHAIIAVNPRALSIADSLDRERARGIIRGPLHGIPIALKDNIHTVDMPTTGGALAFADLVPPYAATVTRNLETAGAIILAKTQMSELADVVAVGMPGNYNALNGYGMNPWDPRRDPREDSFDGRPALGTGGSSSGAGTNVSFWAANVGTETTGSILTPSHQNMLVGIKPTVGRVSRYGVIPFTLDQDTPGPMARTVSDAAILLGVIESAAPDSNDSATGRCPPPPGRDYTKFLNPKGLQGARIGIPRAYFYDSLSRAGEPPAGGLSDSQKIMMAEVIAILKGHGAILVDPANLPSVTDTVAGKNILKWFPCVGPDFSKGRDANCSLVFKYGVKRDFNGWLGSLGDRAPVKSLTELRQWNIAHQRAGAIKYGQGKLDVADEMDLQADRARYEADRRKDVLLSATNGIDAAIKDNRLDALLFPGVAGRNIAARAGYPTVLVPYALLAVAQSEGFPSGFEPKPAPFGVSFTGIACSEPKLIEIAYAFEQATRKRRPPPLFP